MANDALIKLDQGGINARILAKVEKTDFRRIESASRKIPTTFNSPEAKRLFLRYFNSLQLNMHFISVIARTKLLHVDVEKVENSIVQQIEKHTLTVNKAIVDADALCKNNGITSLASYDTEPLTIDVRVISGFGRRYLELMTKVDQLMLMLETLAIDEIIKMELLDSRKAAFKRSIRQVAGAARNFRSGLQRRMNADSENQKHSVEPESMPDPENVSISDDGVDTIQTHLANGVALPTAWQTMDSASRKR